MISDLVSVIMPVYNADQFVAEAIKSVLNQTYSNWELLVVNDGSQDDSEQVVLSFDDERIHYFKQENKGVGAARNLGLENIKGNYFCFLDSDDVFPKESLESRMNVFQKDSTVSFVDGQVQYVDSKLNFLEQKYRPDFEGIPFPELLKLNDKCLFGNTWMIKREKNVRYVFQEDMTHAEDLFFYLSISKGKKYAYTETCILYYRQNEGSAMTNLKGLELGYITLIKKIKSQLFQKTKVVLRLKLKVSKIMILSFLFNGKDVVSAIKTPFKILFA